MNKSALSLLAVGIAILAILVWYLTPPRTEITLPEDGSVSVSLYYYNPALDEGPAGVECSRDGLVQVSREVEGGEELVDNTIRLLIEGSLTEEERAAGITTEFPLEGFSLVGSELSEDGTLTLVFDDSQMRTSGGACRTGILWYQVEETALQFPEVSNVVFLPEELFQP